MIIASVIIGLIAGAICGFKTGGGQWRFLGVLGSLIGFVAGITLLNTYTMLNFEGQMAFTAGVGCFLLTNAICAPIGAAYNT
jgi:hypothetical protein